MNCASLIHIHNEVFAEYYRKKRSEGKPHRVALTHVAKKLVRIIFALETKCYHRPEMTRTRRVRLSLGSRIGCPAGLRGHPKPHHIK
jgi:hypothetical protein